MAIGNSSFVPKDIAAVLSGAENIKITNLPVILANTEYSLVLQTELKAIRIKCRDIATLQYCFVSGQSNLNYWTVPKGCSDEMININFTGKTLYIRSSKASTIIEVVEFY